MAKKNETAPVDVTAPVVTDSAPVKDVSAPVVDDTTPVEETKVAEIVGTTIKGATNTATEETKAAELVGTTIKGVIVKTTEKGTFFTIGDTKYKFKANRFILNGKTISAENVAEFPDAIEYFSTNKSSLLEEVFE